jgi:hypothetical protein
MINNKQHDQCEHIMHEKVEENHNGGYWVYKVCMVCYYSEGYGFLNKEHEIRSLEVLYGQED